MFLMLKLSKQGHEKVWAKTPTWESHSHSFEWKGMNRHTLRVEIPKNSQIFKE